MDESPSIRSSSRARRRSNEGGFALLVALALAVLYFAFVELLMIDVSRELSEARRFRGRVVALTLAENGAELAAVQIATKTGAPVNEDDWQGTVSATLERDGLTGEFKISSKAHSSGPEGANATLLLQGVANPPGDVRILYATHSQ
jgi:hypothetical protein